MLNIENPFKNLKINCYYKYLLVLFGIIFIITLFFDVKGFHSEYLQKISIWIILISAGIWLMEEMFSKINTYLCESYVKGFKRLIGSEKDKMSYC